jgi:hypothetical protein
MTGENGTKPPVVEGPGRYQVYEAPDGGWVIARATGICETCQGCGCGEQAEVVALPDFSKGQAHIIQWLMRNADSGLVRNVRKAVRGRG